MKTPRPFLLALCFSALSFGPSHAADHDFAKWEKEISAYERSDATNPPPKHGFLFIGSSTIRRWTTLSRDFPNLPVVNRGFGGSDIADSTHFADRLIFPHEPRMVLLRAGGNDLWNSHKTPEEVFTNFKEFVTKVHARLPQTEIVFISLSPSIARWSQADKEKAINEMVKNFAKLAPGVKYLETYDMVLGADGKPRPDLFVEDKLHFNAEGNHLLAEKVKTILPSP